MILNEIVEINQNAIRYIVIFSNEKKKQKYVIYFATLSRYIDRPLELLFSAQHY